MNILVNSYNAEIFLFNPLNAGAAYIFHFLSAHYLPPFEHVKNTM